ncbi:hypothetical protein HMPREF1986_02863 [Oribacterium sp. oral taxon 078 str. F0263]|nr:hypothetical protein HMPREF1986_02863 [Oribacterium sp. oral taxon 078 str. F0263]
MRNFNPRSPRGERRRRRNSENHNQNISIHAPLAGSDQAGRGFSEGYQLFQSTLPSRGATLAQTIGRKSHGFQSTLPSRGATVKIFRRNMICNNFNPRSPRGERPCS